MAVILESVISCPHCGHKEEEEMPTDACQWFSQETSPFETAMACFMSAKAVMRFLNP